LAIELDEAEGAPERVFGHGNTDDIVDELDSRPAQVGKDVGPDMIWWFTDEKGIRGRGGHGSC
jgi:hypothetical protein